MKIVFITVAIAFCLSSAFAEQNHQSHSKSTTKEKSALVLNNGKRWPADQDMKDNMGAIYKQFKSTRDLSKSKKLTTEDAHKLSAVINASAKNIISKCKMEQKQDEAFHILLVELFAVAADLEKAKKVESALESLAETLKRYSKYFDHSLSI